MSNTDPLLPRLYSAEQARALDRQAIEGQGVPGYVLMRRAGRAALDGLRARWPDAKSVAVLCGPGNNGGDGYELARLAVQQGLEVRLARIGKDPQRDEARQAMQAWRDLTGEIEPWSPGFAAAAMDHADVVVDAIFGIGMDRAVNGAAAAAIHAINACQRPVLCLDIPSGLDSDCGVVHGDAVRADLTVSFIGRKLGLYLGQGAAYAGERLFDPLGLSAAFVGQQPFTAELHHPHWLRDLLPPRPRTAHKGQHGHLLMIGAEQGMSGAILMAARAALRAGVGLLSVATRAAHAAQLSAAQPEAMFHAVESGADLKPLMDKASVIAIGPGLGTGQWGQALWRAVASFAGPMVVDADALNLWSMQADERPAGACVITPHPGEAARLLGTNTLAIQADRLASAAELRARYQAIAVLKGAGTVVQGQRIRICPFGNPGMAVGGMGDVLTGVIGSLLAQGLSAEDAANAGVLVHALAGDGAAQGGERGLLASDLMERIRQCVNPC